MVLPFVWIITVGLLIFQLFLCFSRAGKLLKSMPMILGGVLDIACWGVLFMDSRWTLFLYGTAFSAYIFGCLILIWLGGILFAWLIYAIVRAAKKQKNNL